MSPMILPWWFDASAGAMAFAPLHPIPWLWAAGCAAIAALLTCLNWADSDSAL